VLPLLAFDQFVVTPEGQKAPSLADPDFPNLGKKRYKRMAAYTKEVEALQKQLKKGETYTFAFWGVSRFLDIISWKLIGIPVVTPMDFSKFAGEPGKMRIVFYGLEPDEKEPRHLESRKTYYFRANLWSSLRRPDRTLMEALTGLTLSDSAGAQASPRRKHGISGMIQRVNTFWKVQVGDPTERFLQTAPEKAAGTWRRSIAEPTEEFVKHSIVDPWNQTVVEPFKTSIAEPTESFIKHKIAEPAENFIKNQIAEPTEQFMRDMRSSASESSCTMRSPERQ